MSDRELGDALSRRAESAVLTDAERVRISQSVIAMTDWRVTRARRWPAWVVPLAAALVIATLAGVAILGAPAPRPGASSPAPDDLHVLSTAELQAAFVVARRDPVPRAVVADAYIDRGVLNPLPNNRGCVRGQACVIGTLLGITPDGVLVRAGPAVRQWLDAHSATDHLIAGNLALSLSSSGIELLGKVEFDGETRLWSIPRARAAADTLDPGAVVAVQGWLGVGRRWRCPTSVPTPPPGSPFDRCTVDAIVSDPATAGPWFSSGVEPRDAILVQPGASEEFGSGTTTPVQATYVLRVVVDPRPACDPCRGWIVVGRLDDTSPDALHILTPAELQVAVTETRRGTGDRLVLARVTLDRASVRAWRGPCWAELNCTVGTIAGLDPPNLAVDAGPAVRTWLESAPADAVTGVLALSLKAYNAFELLGVVELDGTSAVWTLVGADAARDTLRPGVAIVAPGWLVEFDGRRCPALPQPSGTLPPDSPFGQCPQTFLLHDEPPSRGLTVQPGAFDTFARPEDSVPVSHDPRTFRSSYGTYLLRLVTDPREGADPAHGWQMIGRL